jgi:hypothetical protein
MNSYLAYLTSCYQNLARQIEQVPDSQGHVKRSAGKLLPEVARSVERIVLKALPPLIQGSSVTTSISLDKNRYRSTYQYNSEKFKYNTYIERAFCKLIDAGYVQVTTKGWLDRNTGNSDNTKYRLTSKFKTWFLAQLADIGFDGELGDLIVDPVLLPNPYPLRVQKRKQGDISSLEPRTEKIPFAPTAKSEQISRDIQRLNRMLDRTWVDLDLTVDQWKELDKALAKHKKKDRPRFIRFNEKQVYRVFHDTDFNTGGRYYGGWWQTIPKEYRKHLIIDGKATIEVDYSGLHPAILYAREGLPLPEDPYTSILGPRHRDLSKILFNALINARGDPQAPPRGVKIRFPDQSLNWEQIKERIYKVHAPIRQRFCKGSGLWLMHEDSVLATGVLHHFANMGVPCLPVHDSFIVHHGYEEDLRKKMSELFVDRYSSVPSLKDKGVRFYRSDTLVRDVLKIEDLLAALDSQQDNRLDAFRSLC